MIGVLSSVSLAKMNNKKSIYFPIQLIILFFLISTISCTSSKETNMNEKEQNAMNKDMNTAPKPQLVYYYDPLCGWCYGFSEVMSQLHEGYVDKVDFEVISGGLYLGDRVGKVNEIAPYIKEGAYKNVEAATGVKFGQPFLDDIMKEEKIVLNSLPPSIALCIVKEKYPERGLEFAELLLKSVYLDGLNPIETENLAMTAAKMGFDKEEFMTKMADAKYKTMAEKDFEAFNQSGFGGMPALVIEKEGKQILLSNGYTSLDKLKLSLEQHL